ncbi:MAG TPA: RlmE family RNA methyltransferase [Alphaproteobacteria bacterium]|nr:RlmE family RNA methyltransferase [Alphaproteobacteria bacterium]
MAAKEGPGRKGRGARAGSAPSAARPLAQRLHSTKGRTGSQIRWLERQLNDPYVAEARRQGYRSRAAFKLAELDDRLHFLRARARVVDLGAAPGGWTQVAVERTRAGRPQGGGVIAVDLLEMSPVAGAELLQLDFLAPEAPARIRAALAGPADVVMSDMAPASSGHRATDHLRIVALAEAAAEFALEVLAPGGTFVAKVWQGGAERALLERLRRRFAKVRHVKPPASRAESAEVYVVATGFRAS